MASLTLKRRAANDALAERNPVLASAALVQLQNSSWKRYSAVDETWQRDGWYHYTINGPFHFAANWIGNACGRTKVYVAEVDEYGVIAGPTTDKQIAAIAETLFGGPAARAEMLRALGVSLTVAGECYIVGKGGKAGSGKDEWLVAAPYEVRPFAGGVWVGSGAHVEKILDGAGVVIRVWTPNPGFMQFSDSPGRAALVTLREMEQLAKYKASQKDSRLANAGVYPIPAGLDFVYGDQPSGAPSLLNAFVEAATAGLEGKGSAAGVVPIFLEVPAEVLQYMFKEPVRFESILSEQVTHLEDQALKTLAITMNLPPEIVLGTGRSNHWSAWEIGESAVKYHIEPMMNRIIDALTTAYLFPALVRMGKNPARYTFAFDVSALTVRPERLTDALNLYKSDPELISAAAVRKYGDFNELTDVPTEAEITARRLNDLLLRDPSQILNQGVREGAQLNIDLGPNPTAGGTPPPPPPAPQELPARSSVTPERPAATSSDTLNDGIIAAVELVGPPSALLVGADALVRAAMQTAGKRLLTTQFRGQFPRIPADRLHTVIRVRDGEHADKLIASAFDNTADVIEGCGVDPTQFRALLASYTCGLLRRQGLHSRGLLASVLAEHGLLG